MASKSWKEILEGPQGENSYLSYFMASKNPSPTTERKSLLNAPQAPNPDLSGIGDIGGALVKKGAEEALTGDLFGSTAAGSTASSGVASAPFGGALSADGSLIFEAPPAAPIGSSIDGGLLLSDGTSTAASGAGTGAGIGVAPYLGAAGALKSGYDLYNVLQADAGRTESAKAGAVAGAGAGAGLAAAAPLLIGAGPVGWAGLAAAALLGGGLGAGLGGIFGDKSTKEIEAERWKGLGLPVPEFKDYFAGTEGEKSRDEKYLTADAIRYNPDNYRAASDWDKWSKDQQDRFLQTLLDEGKVTEKKGGIYLDDKRAKELASEIRKDRAAIKEGERQAAKQSGSKERFYY